MDESEICIQKFNKRFDTQSCVNWSEKTNPHRISSDSKAHGSQDFASTKIAKKLGVKMISPQCCPKWAQNESFSYHFKRLRTENGVNLEKCTQSRLNKGGKFP